MFSKTEMVRARKAIESLYNGKCTITEHEKVKKENKSTGFVETVIVENQPCKISFSTINSTNSTETGASALVSVVKLFIAPEVRIQPGSKITVTQNNVTTEYQNSGQPAFYNTHQEVILELFKGWS